MKAKIKYWFLGNYWWLLLILFFLMSGLIIFSNVIKRWELAISGTTILITSFFFIQKQRIEELRLFQEIFKEYNKRYDLLNDDLNRIFNEEEASPISDEDRTKLYDYFNLCGEEYFYYKQRHIYPEVWDSWVNGMKYYYANSRIQKMWDEELEQNSYYGFDKNLIQQ